MLSIRGESSPSYFFFLEAAFGLWPFMDRANFWRSGTDTEWKNAGF